MGHRASSVRLSQFVVTIIVVAAVLGEGCGGKSDKSQGTLGRGGESAHQWITQRVLVLGFERPGVRVLIGVPRSAPSIEPSAPFERMLVARGGETRSLSDLSELYRFVAVRSESDALNFVRLRTAPHTWHTWADASEGPLLEIIPARSLDELPTYGLSADRLRHDTPGYMAMLTVEQWDAFGFTAPIVVKSGDLFKVSRWLLRATGPSAGAGFASEHRYEVLQVVEWVGGSEGYRMTVERRLPGDQFPGVDWAFPVFK